MNRNKKIIYIMVVLLVVIAGVPSIHAVPDGFDYA